MTTNTHKPDFFGRLRNLAAKLGVASTQTDGLGAGQQTAALLEKLECRLESNPATAAPSLAMGNLQAEVSRLTAELKSRDSKIVELEKQISQHADAAAQQAAMAVARSLAGLGIPAVRDNGSSSVADDDSDVKGYTRLLAATKRDLEIADRQKGAA